MLHAVRHADFLERVVHALLALTALHAAIRERQLHILVDGEIADQVERLEDESDLPIANPRSFGRTQLSNRLAIEQIRAIRWRVEQPEDGEQRGLPASRRAGDREIATALHFEMNSRERVRLDLVGIVDLRDPIETQQR